MAGYEAGNYTGAMYVAGMGKEDCSIFQAINYNF